MNNNKPIKLVIISIILIIYSCSESNDSKRIGDRETITCDAEEVVAGYFVNNNYKFENGNTQSSDLSLSGDFSSKVNDRNQKGMGMKLDNLLAGEIYGVTVWKYSENPNQGGLIIKTSWGSIDTLNVPLNSNSRGWSRHKWLIHVNEDFKDPQSIEIITFNDGDKTIYFDDLSITKKVYPKEYTESPGLETAELVVSDQDLEKLKAKRDKAIKKWVLVTKKKDKVPAILLWDRKKFETKVRLKGDWLDHLYGIKWSFRVEVMGEKKWLGMKEFSFQNPMTRYLLDEWVLHKFLEEADVITPRYEFINLKLNGKSLGLYVYEEHFKDELLEYFKRTPAPIIRFDESGMWDFIGRTKSEKNYYPFAGANIKGFDQGTINRDTARTKLFEAAQDLLHAYKYSLKPTSEIFDVDKLARFYAVMDMTKSYHGFAWHNVRYYFNPESMLLEPIAFDGYSSFGITDKIKRPFLGFGRNPNIQLIDLKDKAAHHIYQDTTFMVKYVEYLQFYSKTEYIDAFFDKYSNRIEIIEQYIFREFPQYDYNWKFLYSNGDIIRNLIYPVEHLSLKAHLQSFSNGTFTYKVGNTHSLPIKFIGVGDKAGIKYKLLTAVYLPAINPETPIEMHEVELPKSGKYAYYKVLGLDELYKVRVLTWKAPSTNAKELSDKKLSGIKHFAQRGNYLFFKNSPHAIINDIVIPAGFEVIMPKGSMIDLQKGASFICNSTLYCKGTENDPVVFQSNDGTGKIVIQNAGKTTYITHTKFINIGNSISFLKTNIKCNEVAVIGNKGKQSIEIVESKFKMTNLYLNECNGNAISIKDSHGNISKCLIENGKKNGIEVFNSVVKLENLFIDTIKENALIAVGYANVELGTIKITNAKTAINCSDFSVIKIKDLSLGNVDCGFSIIPNEMKIQNASVTVEALHYHNTKTFYNINSGALLQVGSEVYERKI